MNHLEPACKNSLKFPNRLHVDGVSDPGVYEVRLGARRESFMGPCHETVCASSRQGFTGIIPQLATSVTGGIASGFERKRNSVGGSSGPVALARRVPFRIDSVAIHSLAEPVSRVSKNLEIVRSFPSTAATLLNSILSRDLRRSGIQPINRSWADPRRVSLAGSFARTSPGIPNARTNLTETNRLAAGGATNPVRERSCQPKMGSFAGDRRPSYTDSDCWSCRIRIHACAKVFVQMRVGGRPRKHVDTKHKAAAIRQALKSH